VISVLVLESIAQACARHGVKHLKTADIELEIDLERTAWNPGIPAASILGSSPLSDYASPAKQENKDQPENPDATEKLKDLINTLKLPDGDLLDKIFPAGAGG
jgi:hypothetical protein